MSNVKWFGSFANAPGSAFTSAGATLTQIPLGTEITAGTLANTDVLIFGSGIGDTLTAAEIAAMKAFVEAGGKLIVVGEVSFFPAINNEGNSLLGGIGAKARLVGGNLSGTATYGNAAQNTEAGLVGKTFELSNGSSVSANGATVLAALSGGTAVLTVETVGANGGQVFVLSDNVNPGKDFALSMLPDSAPSLPTDTSVSYAENQTTTVFDAAATDDRSTEGNGLTYSIVDGGDGASFAIDPATGKLTFLTKPDFEAPTDADGNNSYVVTIRAQDSAGQTDDQTITVNVTDVDDTAPTGLTASSVLPTDGGDGFKILAAKAAGTFDRWDWTAIDTLLAGTGASSIINTTATTLDYSGSNTPFGNSDYFAIKATGFITIPESGEWTFQTYADDGLRLLIDGREVDFVLATWPGTGSITLAAGTYAIEATYFEIVGGQTFSLSARGPGESAFTLVNSASSPLQVTQSLPLENTVLVQEGAVSGTKVATFSATDSDPNLTYSLASGEGDQGNALFQVNGNSLFYRGGADYETNPDLSIRSRVTDSAGNWTEKVINVGVLDSNEAPTKSGTIALVAGVEDTAYVVTKASLLSAYSDPEGGTLSISNLTSSNGTVTDLGDSYRITPSLHSNGTVTLTFSVTDGTNTLTNQTATFNLAAVPDAPTSIASAVNGTEDTTYVFKNADFKFSDSADAPADAFAGAVISTLPANGTLSLNGVAVTAGQFISAADIAAGNLTFLGARDFNGSTSFTFQVRDTAAVGAWETRHWNQSTPVELISGWSGSGYHSGIGAFAPGTPVTMPTQSAVVFLERSHGAISTISTNDNQTAMAETGATYTLGFDQINANGYGSSSVTVRVFAGDILLLQTTTGSISESTEAARSFTTDASAADLTGLKLRVVFESASGLTFLDNITLTKVGGDGANLLINGNFGSRDWAPGQNQSTTAATMTIQLESVNDAPVITSNGGGDTAAISVAENGTAVTTLTVADDGGASNLGYKLTGDDAALFDFNSTTRTLTFKSAPDFETPASADGDNIYTVTIIAHDTGNLFDSQTITVTVTDVDDTPPQVAITAEQTTLTEEDGSTLLTFTFTEPVAGLALGDFTVQGGTLSNLTQSTENPLVWTALLTGAANTDVQTAITLTIGQGFTDLAGNAGSITTAPTLTIDTTADIGGNLALTLDSLSDDGVLDPADASFSVAGLDADATATLTVTSSGGGSFTFADITGNGAYTLSPDLFAELGGGTLTLTLNVTDKSGNTASSEQTATFDVTPPEVTSAVFSGMLSDDGVIADADVAAGNLITLSITFSEAMNTADPDAIQITLPEGCGLTETGTRLWNGNTLTITYELADTGIDIADLAVTVADARDVVGNVMEQQTVQSGASVDTLNPEGHAGSATRAEVPDELAAGLGATELVAFSLAEGETLRFASDGNPLSAFALDGNRLLIGDAAAFDFEVRTQLVANLIVSDAAGNETAYAYTINLTDTNDAPILRPGGLAQVAGTIAEGATTLTTSGVIQLHDDDTANRHTVVVRNLTTTHDEFVGLFTAGLSDLLRGDGDGAVTWTYTVASEAHRAIVESLAEGETLTQTYRVTLRDDAAGNAKSIEQIITITITGTNDAPTVTGTAEASLTDGETLLASGSLTVADTDLTDTVDISISDVTHDAATLPAGLTTAALLAMLQLGPDDALAETLEDIAADGTGSTFGWTFSAPTDAFAWLGEGASLTLTYTLKAVDSAGDSVTHPVTVTITGSNDAPVITLGLDQTASAALVETDAGLAASGSFSVSDIDAGDSLELSISLNSATGATGGLSEDALSAMMTAALADGQAEWTFDSADTAFDHLTDGETLTLVYEFTLADASGATDTQKVTITITGTNDTATITGDVSGEVTEDTGLSTSGKLSITDADTGESLFVALPESARGDAGYGHFTMDEQGNWTYALDPGSVVVQALPAGETLTDTIAVTSLDGGTTQVITVTITGTNDGATIGGTSAGSIAEDATAPLSGILTITDIDTGEAVFTPIAEGTEGDGGYGSFALAEDGTWTYEIDNSLAAVQALGLGETLTDNLTVTSADGSATVTLTVTITGTDDAPEITVGTAETGEGSVYLVDDSGLLTGPAGPDTLRLHLLSAAPEDAPATDLYLTKITETDSADVYGIDGITVSLGDGILPAGYFDSFDSETILAAITIDTAGIISLDRNSAFLDALGEGDALDLIIAFDLVETHPDGSTTLHPQQTTLRITGSNDAPQIIDDSDIAKTVEEFAATDAGHNLPRPTVEGSILFNDPDLADRGRHEVTVTPITAEGTPDETAYLGTFTAGYIDIGSGRDGHGEIWYRFDLDDAEIDALREGESFRQVYTLTLSDGETTFTRDIVITITGTNDAPILLARPDGEDFTLIEDRSQDLAAADSVQSVSAKIVFDDADTGSTAFGTPEADTHVVAATLASVALDGITVEDYAGPLGDIVIGPIQRETDSSRSVANFTYSIADADFDSLAAGRKLTFTYTVTVTDSSGAESSQDLVFTIIGTNDSPTITVSEDSSLAVTESGALADGSIGTEGIATASGQLMAMDPDIGGADVTEWAGLAVNGTLNSGTTDPETGSFTLQGRFGTLTFDQTGEWIYTLDNESAETAALAAGDTATEVFTISLSDGQGGTAQQDIKITVTGTNDLPVIDVAESDLSGAASESSPDAASQTADLEGTIVFADADLGDSVEVILRGDDIQIAYRAADADSDSDLPEGLDADALRAAFSITSDGHWTYSPAMLDLEALGLGDTVTLTFPVEVGDGTGHAATAIRIVLTGTNDAPTHAGSLVVTTTEDGLAEGLDLLQGAADVDAGDVLSVTNVVITGPGAGLAQVEGNRLTFDQAALQALSETDSREVTVTYDITDISGATVSQSLTVTITGNNDAVAAKDDAFRATEGTLTSGINLLTAGTGADTDPEGDRFSITGIADIDDATGTTGSFVAVDATPRQITSDWGANVSLLSNGNIFYDLTSGSARFNQLGAGETAVDTFVYRVADEHGATSTATVSVTITGVNDAIVAVDDVINLSETGGTGSLLSNDTDADRNDTKTVTAVLPGNGGTSTVIAGGFRLTTANGIEITVTADGTYSARSLTDIPAGVSRTTSFTYFVRDSGGAQSFATATVTLTGDNSAPLVGNGTNQWSPRAIESGMQAAALFPQITVADAEGDSVTFTFRSGPANGLLLLNGSALVAGQVLTLDEMKALAYQSGAVGTYTALFEVSDGHSSNDVTLNLRVTAGTNSSRNGTAGNDLLDGGAGNDTLSGAAGDDTLHGGTGSDVLSGDAGNDALFGGMGNDRLAGGAGADRLFGGDGQDMADYAASSAAVRINLMPAANGQQGASGGDATGDQLFEMEQVNGSRFADRLTGNNSANLLSGNDGNDTLSGNSGNDTLLGGNGRDVIAGGRGADLLTGGDGADTFVFRRGDGIDRITDFSVGEDIIRLHGLATGFDQINLTADSDGVRVGLLGGGTIAILQGVTLDSLTEGHFLFL